MDWGRRVEVEDGRFSHLCITPEVSCLWCEETCFTKNCAVGTNLGPPASQIGAKAELEGAPVGPLPLKRGSMGLKTCKSFGLESPLYFDLY